MTNVERIDEAVSAHTHWFIKLRVAIIEGSSQFKPEIVRTDTNCDFGNWLYGDFPREVAGSHLLAEIRALHSEFHKEAAHILELAIAGKKDEALSLLDDDSKIRKCSADLLNRLSILKSSC